MSVVEKKILKLGFHTWWSIILMISSFFLMHGIIRDVEGSSGLLETVMGGVLCFASIIIGALPHPSK